jgi:hypothetical protein
LTHANAATPEDAVAEVGRQKAQGADFIKIIELTPDAFFAVADETKRLGIRFIGHLNPNVSPWDASSVGMRSIEHLGPRDSILLGCSSDEPALRQLVAQHPPQAPPNMGPIPASVILRALSNPTIFTSPAEFVRYQRAVDTYSEAKCRDLAARFVVNGTWQVPTLIRLRTMELADDQAYRNDPNLRYVPQATKQMWQELEQTFQMKIAPDQRKTLGALFALQMKVVKPFKEAGAKMMTGSDQGGVWVIPGFGLHQEFDLLAKAGLPPLEVLQMTTLNGAEFLGRESSMGSVAEGKDANLVLLKANPIVSIQNLHGISGVVRGGSYYNAYALDALKRRTEERLLTWQPPASALRPPCC